MTTDHDVINHPPHYNSGEAKCECGRRIECIDITRHLSFNTGNAVKYLWRFAHKNGIEDLKKARWYLDDAIKSLEKENINPIAQAQYQSLKETLSICENGRPSDSVEYDICEKLTKIELMVRLIKNCLGA